MLSVANYYNISIQELWEFLSTPLQFIDYRTYNPGMDVSERISRYEDLENKITKLNGTFDLEKIVHDISATDMIMYKGYCHWFGRNMTMECDPNIFKPVITRFGVCYSFGLDNNDRPFDQIMSGSGNGFVIGISINHDEYSGKPV